MIKIRLFNASPGDVADERQALAETVVPELGRILSAFASVANSPEVDLEAIRWETHSWPDVGEDAQDVINRQLSDFDIFVGVMWKRFGTPTKRAGSGTGEEFERAYNLYSEYGLPRIMFYFRTAPFYPSSREEIEQLGKVFEFRERLEKLGVRYWEYNDPIDFERFVREHLLRQILDLAYATSKASEAPERSTSSISRPIEVEPVPEHRVFISYSPEDRESARKLDLALNEAGADTWLDFNDLLPGQRWQEEIVRAIRASSVFLLLLSSNSAEKTGYIQKEIRFALEEMDRRPTGQTYIIPVRLDDSAVPNDLASLQWVDMFLDWNSGLDAILRALRSLPHAGLPANPRLESDG